MSVDQQVIEALTKVSYNQLDPLPYFQNFSKQYGRPVTNDPRYTRPTYPWFDDFDYRHATSITTPIYLNDFDFNLEEDREKLIKLIRSDFETDTFDTVAKCQCGRLHGNYLEGSGRICPNCQTKVERLIDSELSTKVWLRLPEGVDTFINPGMYRTYLQKIATASPKIEIITYIIDSSYRRQVKARSSEKGRQLISELDRLGIELTINGFYRKADLIMQHFLIGEGRVLTSLKNADAELIFKHYVATKSLLFCSHLPVPNKLSVIVERYGKDRYAASSQLKSNSVYEAIADTRRTTDYYKVTEDDIKDSVDRVGKAIPKMAELRSHELKEFAFPKKAIFRKHVASGSLQFTGRSVITSRTGLLDPGEISVPWVMALAQLRPFVLSHLYRLGYAPLKAEELIAKSVRKITPEIDKFFEYHEKRREIIAKSGRMPSIQYLSRRAFYARINRDLEDESIGLPILSVSSYNADFDGEYLPSLNFFNCWDTLKLIPLQVKREFH